MPEPRHPVDRPKPARAGSSGDPSISLQDRRLDLEPKPGQDAATRPFLWTEEVGLRFELRFAGGRSCRASFDATRRPAIARAFASTVWNDHARGRGFRSPSMVGRMMGLHGKLVAFLDEVDPGQRVTTMADLTPALADGFHAHLDRVTQSACYATQLKLWFHSSMRAVNRWSDLGEGFLGHLDRIPKGRAATFDPREPYPAEIAKQAFEGALKDVDAVVERILRIGPARLAAGRDPAIAGWDSVENVMWHLVHVGPATLPRLGLLAGRPVDGDKVREAAAHLYPNTDEVLAFLVLLALDVGLPVGSLIGLAPDCLANAAGRMIDLRYHKLRSGQVNAKVERVRDDGPYSPAWLIRTLLSLTATLRDAAPIEQRSQLFLSVPGGSRAKPCRGRNVLAVSCVEPCKRFAARHGLSDGDGEKLGTLVLARLRKTAWADRYAQVGGAFTAVARDHTPNVAARHYGLVKHLAPLHDRTMREALDDALAAALGAAERRRREDLPAPGIQPMVLDGEAEASLATDKGLAAERLGMTAAAAEELLDGLLDVWIASCRDMSSSPFGTVDGVCRIPLWGCLMCPNAVVTARKLPAILSLKADLVEAGRYLPTAAWKERFGPIYRTIVDGILPRFSEAERTTAARMIADPAFRLPSLPFNRA